MFVQQPFRVQAEPIMEQESPVLLDSAIRQHYISKGQEQSTSVLNVLRIDVVNPVLVGQATQVDVIVSVETDTVDFFNQFIHYFIEDEETDALRILRIS